ncbi:MAG: hypothetical protein JNN30_13385 [Rhodanobacteraceae bacterium]|nr:hypothetical protein [Rhodanobacteraceae bacterium]
MNIDDFIHVTEVDQGPPFAEPLFQRNYKTSAPDFPHHVVAFWKREDGSFVPASYVHFTDCGDIFLAGGAATDGDLLRTMSQEQRAVLAGYGGLMLATLRYGFERWAPRCDAIFTCCGDARALQTTPKLGFAETGIEYLLVHWTREISARRQRELVAKARSFMPF